MFLPPISSSSTLWLQFTLFPILIQSHLLCFFPDLNFFSFFFSLRESKIWKIFKILFFCIALPPPREIAFSRIFRNLPYFPPAQPPNILWFSFRLIAYFCGLWKFMPSAFPVFSWTYLSCYFPSTINQPHKPPNDVPDPLLYWQKIGTPKGLTLFGRFFISSMITVIFFLRTGIIQSVPTPFNGGAFLGYFFWECALFGWGVYFSLALRSFGEKNATTYFPSDFKQPFYLFATAHQSIFGLSKMNGRVERGFFPPPQGICDRIEPSCASNGNS